MASIDYNTWKVVDLKAECRKLPDAGDLKCYKLRKDELVRMLSSQKKTKKEEKKKEKEKKDKEEKKNKVVEAKSQHTHESLQQLTVEKLKELCKTNHVRECKSKRRKTDIVQALFDHFNSTGPKRSIIDDMETGKYTHKTHSRKTEKQSSKKAKPGPRIKKQYKPRPKIKGKYDDINTKPEFLKLIAKEFGIEYVTTDDIEEELRYYHELLNHSNRGLNDVENWWRKWSMPHAKSLRESRLKRWKEVFEEERRDALEDNVNMWLPPKKIPAVVLKTLKLEKFKELAKELKISIGGKSIQQLWNDIRKKGVRDWSWLLEDARYTPYMIADDVTQANMQHKEYIPAELKRLAKTYNMEDSSLLSELTYDELLHRLNLDIKPSTKVTGNNPKDFPIDFKSHDATAALHHMQKLVSKSEPTWRCRGSWSNFRILKILNAQCFSNDICYFFADNPVFVEEESNQWTVKKSIYTKRDWCDKSADIWLVPILLEFNNGGGHGNFVLVNHTYKTIEMFEPNGNDYDEAQMRQKFMEREVPKWLGLHDYKFLSPYDSCPSGIGPQAITDAGVFCLDGGYCAAYSELYINLRMYAPAANPEDTIKSLQGLSKRALLDLIRRYITWQDYLVTKNIPSCHEKDRVYHFWNQDEKKKRERDRSI